MVKINRKWYERSSLEIKNQLKNLDDGYSSFLETLSQLPDEVGDVQVLRLVKLEWCTFSLIAPVFEICKGGKAFTHKFDSWKMGMNSGSEGVLFLKDDEKTTSFVIFRQSQFAIYADIANAIASLTCDDNFPLSDIMKCEIEEEVGFLEDKIEVIDLGFVYPDSSKVSSRIRLFAAFTSAKALNQKNGINSKKTKSKAEIYSIEEIWKFASSFDFLAIIARLWAQGHII